MDTKMEQPLPSEMSLVDLAEYSACEMKKYRRKEESNDQYCLEILRRAIILKDNNAWCILQDQLSDNVRMWIGRHPQRELALRYDNESSYLCDAFRRFWQAVSDQKLSFTALAGALSYLHLCLHCAITDNLRTYARPREEPIPDYGQSSNDEPSIDDLYHEGELWEIINGLLAGEKERKIAYLHFHCNLKAREIMRYCPNEFSNESEIYRLKRNVMERILRNRDKIRWKLSD